MSLHCHQQLLCTSEVPRQLLFSVLTQPCQRSWRLAAAKDCCDIPPRHGCQQQRASRPTVARDCYCVNDFLAARLLQECQGRASAAPAAPAPAAVAVVAAVAGPSSASSSQQVHLQQHRSYQDDEGEDEDTPAITFKLLMKKGGKDDRSKEILVSGSCKFLSYYSCTNKDFFYVAPVPLRLIRLHRCPWVSDVSVSDVPGSAAACLSVSAGTWCVVCSPPAADVPTGDADRTLPWCML